jgi:DNA polymerase-1
MTDTAMIARTVQIRYLDRQPTDNSQQMLSPEHRHMLEVGSGIAPDVIAEQGYWSCTHHLDLYQQWIRPIRGATLPGLCIPIHRTAGGLATYAHPTTGATIPYTVYRPDTEMLDSRGRPRKYLNPPGTSIRLDCHPRVVPVLRDRAVPLWIVEGSKKAGALITRGASALALLGVSCWRGRDSAGGKAVLPDWLEVTLNQREVRICFDSDVLAKDAVDRELRLLATWLQSRDAVVHIAYLPSDSAAKCGVDDYLLTHTLGQLESLLEAPRKGKRARRQPADPADTRPMITLVPDVVPVVDGIEAAIHAHSDPPRLYQWNRMLAVIGQDRKPPPWLRDATDALVIHPATPDYVFEEASRAARFERYDGRIGEMVTCLPPMWAIRCLLARPGWNFPHLSGILTAPTVLADGRLLDQPGYDPDSGLYLAFPQGRFPTLPRHLTRDVALEALERLKQPSAEFRFVSNCHRSTALGALLTLVARDAIPGNLPAIGVTAPTPGSGKGLLIDTLTIAATGVLSPKWSNITDDVELDKRFFSAAVSGRRVLCIDNIARPFGNEVVDAVLTAGVVAGRILGSTNDTIVPFRALLFLSGNNLSYVGDMLRRVLPIVIDPCVEHPEDLTFEIPDLPSWVTKHRPQLVMDALTILKAFLTAPPEDTKPHQDPWGSFDGWSHTIRACLRWLGEADPLEGRTELREQADPHLENLLVLLTAWDTCLGRATTTLRDLIHTCQTHIEKDPKHLTTEDQHYRHLYDALLLFDTRPGATAPDPKRVGNALKRWQRRVVNGLRLVEVGKDRKGIALWRVEPPPTRTTPLTPPQPAGSAGSAGSGGIGYSAVTKKEEEKKENNDSSLGVNGEDPARPCRPGTDPAQVSVSVSGFYTTPVPYTFLTDPHEVAKRLPQFLQHKLNGIDIETRGLRPVAGLWCLTQLASPEHILLIDMLENTAGMLDALRPLFASAVQLVGDNVQFELRWFQHYGLPRPKVPMLDVMLAEQLLHAGTFPDGKFSLEGIAKRNLGYVLDKRWQKSDWTRRPLLVEQLQYAATDAAVPLELWPAIRQRLLDADLAHAYTIELNVLPVIAAIARTGMPLDAAQWRVLAEAEAVNVAQLHHELIQLSERDDILWTSPDQVAALIRSRGHTLPLTKKKKNYQTTNKALTPLIARDPLIQVFLKWRKAQKLVSTYGLTLLEGKPADNDGEPFYVESTGRLYGDLHQAGTRTGRMASSKPNLQNLPRDKRYRRCFVAKPGYALVKADFSQIEVRAAAVIYGCEVMIAALKSGADIHRLTAANLLHIPESEVTEEQRRMAKAVVFGMLFGMGGPGLQEYAFTTYGVVMTLDAAKGYIEQFYTMYPGAARYRDAAKRDRRQVIRMPTGRLRIIHPVMKEWGDGSPKLDYGYTVRLNTPVQGSACDVMKAALIRIDAHLHGVPGIRLCSVVHDEIIAEVPLAHVDMIQGWLKQHMNAAFIEILGDIVPCDVEVTVGLDWAGTPLPATPVEQA